MESRYIIKTHQKTLLDCLNDFILELDCQSHTETIESIIEKKFFEPIAEVNDHNYVNSSCYYQQIKSNLETLQTKLSNTLSSFSIK